MADEQISLSSLLFVVVISGFAIRYFFFGGSSSSPTAQRQSGRDGAAAARAREQAVERIQQMFPQVDRRTILWDLQRTGGSVQSTTERVLAGRTETPPITFQPPPVPSSPTPPTQTQAAKTPSKPIEPDLITRYNLQSKVDNTSEDSNSKKGWSSNRDERQSALQRRRDEMIIAARKKMEAKIKADIEAGKSS